MESTPVQRVVRFGAFEVDLRSRELRKHGLKIKLQDQPFHVLELLLEHPGDLITREELQRQIWSAHTLVDFELGLNTAVKRLRQALGDSAENPHFVETLPRRGYRFVFPINTDSPSLIANVEGIDAITGPTITQDETASIVERLASPREVGRRRRWIFAALSILLIALLSAGGYFAARLRRTVTPDVRIHSVAVLPLENLSADPQQEYFADGMTDELITNLAKLGSVRVISRTSVMQYKRTRKPVADIGRELSVDAIVEGTVIRSGDNLRITAQLIRAASEQHLWADEFRGELRDVLTLQSQVARAIADQIHVKLTQQTQVARPPTM